MTISSGKEMNVNVMIGDNSGVEYIYTNEYAYQEGSVGISWWCSFDRSAQDWINISSLWANYYKISIITPTE